MASGEHQRAIASLNRAVSLGPVDLETDFAMGKAYLASGQHGLAILNEGLREYEALVDDDRTLAITLVRSFTAMQTPEIGQWDVYPWMKLTQSLGTNQCHYAILPHAGNWQDGNLYRAAEHFDLPLETAQAGRGGGQMPKDHSFLQVGPETIALSACKQCDQRDSLIVRLYNPTSDQVTGQIVCDRPLQQAWITNMNEERREPLKVTGNRVEVPFSHKQIMTVELVLKA